MIEIRTEQHGRGERQYGLTVDGVDIPRASAYVYGLGRQDVSVMVRDEPAITLVRRERLREIPGQITRLSVGPTPSEREADFYVRPNITRSRSGGPLLFSFVFVFRVQSWKRPWSMGEMRDAAQALIESNVVDGLRWNAERRPMAVPSFQIDVSPVDENATIGEVLDKWVPLVTSLVSQLERDLTARARPDSLVALFDFPLEVRTPCEQYLLYFIEFLRDVGVEAQADLSHDAGRVLFSVTPTHGQEALGQIREALTAYLELPAAAELDITSIEADPRVQQLVANIQHLKGQLYIASAALQLKDATIAQLSIQRTSRSDLLLTGAVIPESLRAIDTSRPEEDCEEVIPGIVKLTEYSAKGVSINLAELYRRLRRRLLGPGDSGDHGSSTAT